MGKSESDSRKGVSTRNVGYSVLQQGSNLSADKPLTQRQVTSDGEIGSTEVTTEGESTLLVPFFNFFYYTAIIPFKTSLDKKTSSYYLHTKLSQQIVCGFLHIILIVFAIHTLVAGCFQFKGDTETTIIATLELTCNFSSLICTILILLIMWGKRGRNEYLCVIELTRCSLKHPRLVSFAIYSVTSALSLVLILICWFTMHEEEHYGSISNLGIYGFSKNSSDQNATMDPSFHTTHAQFDLRNGIALTMHVLILHSSIFYILVQGMFFNLALALRQIGKEFQRKLRNLKEEVDIQQGIQLYRELKVTTNLIRKVFGDTVLLFFIGAVSYYAETPYILLGRRGDSEKAVLVYFLINGVNWIIAAQFHYTTFNALLAWISFHMHNDSLNCGMRFRLLSISSEISADPIALSSRCFSVTYQHLSSMFGVIATYGIIVFQLNSG